MSCRKSAFPGIDVPARHLFFLFIICLNWLIVILCSPTWRSVPTMALTMFLRNLFAVMTKV